MIIHEKASKNNGTLLSLFPEGTLSMADVIRRIDTDESLTEVRKRDLSSALRRIAAVTQIPARELPADPNWLRQRLRRLSPAGLGIAAKSWANIMSNAKAALAHAGVIEKPFRKSVLSSSWQARWEQLDDVHLRMTLSRLVTYCSRSGIEPCEVTDQTIDDFMRLFSSLRKDPARARYLVTTSWNKAAGKVTGWPSVRLTVPKKRIIFRAYDRQLPLSFRKDLDHYMALMAGQDLLADDAPPKPLSDASLKQYRRQIYRFFGELIAADVEARDIRDLSALVRPDRVDIGLRRMINRNGGKTSQNIFMTSYMLKNIAKHYCKLGASKVRKLEMVSRKLRVPYRGMTPRNRERLRQFDDAKNASRLLHLSQELVAEAKRGTLAPKQLG